MLLFKRSTFIQQECITLIKSDEGIHNATKDFFFKQMLFFYIYSQVHKYWDIDTILTFLALYTTTMDFK